MYWTTAGWRGIAGTPRTRWLRTTFTPIPAMLACVHSLLPVTINGLAARFFLFSHALVARCVPVTAPLRGVKSPSCAANCSNSHYQQCRPGAIGRDVGERGKLHFFNR